MVKSITCIQDKQSFMWRVILAITTFVIAFSFLSQSIFASQIKINNQDVEKIQNALDVAKTTSEFGSILLDGGGLIKALNTVIKGGQTTTDITYGLLVLTAVNEMEYMDLVLSGECQTRARNYFNQILDERINLLSYWRGIGFDLPKVTSGYITGPIGALTLNTFAMSDKVIQIFTVFNVLIKEKQCDGLWYYFNLRKNDNESHETAWQEASEVMGFAAKPSSFRGNVNPKSNIETQFSSLYDRWAPHVTPYGISDEYKEQAKEEMRNMLIAVAEKERIAQLKKAQEPSWLNKQIEELKVFVVAIGSGIKSAISGITNLNPFGAGPVAQLPDEANDKAQKKVSEISPQSNKKDDVNDVEHPSILEPEIEEKVKSAEATSTIINNTTITEAIATTTKDIATNTKIINITTSTNDKITTSAETITIATTTPTIATSTTKISKDKPHSSEPELCQKQAGSLATRYRVLINEIAWMGSQNSSNDEWIELKNIWGIPINLQDWQLQDKEQQI